MRWNGWIGRVEREGKRERERVGERERRGKGEKGVQRVMEEDGGEG